MKIGRIIMYNTAYILATIILAKQYLWEQIRKAAGWLEDVFMQAALAEADQPPKL